MERRALLIKNVAGMFPVASFLLDFQNLVEGLRPGTWLATVPIGATAQNAIQVIVDKAILEDWVRPLFQAIKRNPANAAELDLIQAELDDVTQPTVDDPSKEVLLESTRPFAGRDELRFALKELFKLAGSTLLRVNGEEKTGKSFSFYLAQHVARQTGFIASQFDLDVTPDPQVLAADVIGRVGAALDLTRVTGLESGQRTIGKEYADQVKAAIEAQKQKRLFVFDFPGPKKPEPPPETVSFVVRLVQYADAELRPLLRVVLIGFNGEISDAIDDVAERDEAHGFTTAEMLEALKQIAKARKWDVSDEALQKEIDAVATKTLRERFQLMRKTIRKLANPPTSQGPT